MNPLDRLETTLRVRGGYRLHGSVPVHGAKNAALPIMAASLLANTPVVLHGVPRITDVSVMWSLLEALGAKVRREEDGLMIIDPVGVNTTRAPYTLVRKLAASFDIVGPLLGRFGLAEVPLPGGCVLGTRATDMHEQALRALGADVTQEHGFFVARARGGNLEGGTVEFRMPSVGATKNSLLAAVLARGTSLIRNAAMEPEVTDLANFLVAMGARVTGQGTTELRVEGVRELRGVEYTVIPDRIVAGTFLLFGAATRGDVTVTRCIPQHLDILAAKLEECGATVTSGDDWMRVQGERINGGTDIVTAPYPGFPTDLQPPMVAFLCTTPGTSVVQENIFNARFSYINELTRMGADVRVGMESNTALVKGGAPLSGAPVEVPDIRAGAGLVLAALVAEGVTEILELQYLDRGYEGFEEMLSSLGAQVQRTSDITMVFEPVGMFETSIYPKIG